jgi:microcystin-dependent protein
VVQYLTPTTPIPAGSFCLRIVVPNDTPWRSALFGALDTLTTASSWVQDGLLTPDDTVQYLQAPVLEALESGDWCMIGTIVAFATTDLPPHCLLCDGSTYLRENYSNLYDALRPIFHVDADSFIVPDLRERFVLGASADPDADYYVGREGGEFDHTLTVSEMPAHSHTDLGHLHSVAANPPGIALSPGELPVALPEIPATGATSTGNANLQDTGDGEAHNNTPPYFVLQWAIFYE